MQVLTRSDVELVAVVGDIHLGRGDGRTGFGGDISSLVEDLETLADDVDLLVLNGDLYDLDRGSLPLRFRHELALVRRRWPEIEPLLRRPDVVLLSGNHDAVLARVGMAAQALELGGHGLRVRVEHGERFDAWVKRWRAFTSLVTWCSGVASRAGQGQVYRLLRAAERVAVGDEDEGHVLRIRRWLVDAGYDAIVFGHTHVRHASKGAGGWLLNPGASMDTTTRWLTLDLRRAEVTFVESEPQDGRRVVDRRRLVQHDPAT